MDLFREITTKTNLLDAGVKELKTRGQASADKERRYRIALSAKILELRSNGTPVTIIGDIARGDKEIAQLKMDRDIAEALYKSALEAINVYKLQLRLLENQLERDWGQAKRT